MGFRERGAAVNWSTERGLSRGTMGWWIIQSGHGHRPPKPGRLGQEHWSGTVERSGGLGDRVGVGKVPHEESNI